MRPDQYRTVTANEVRSTGPTWDHWPAGLPQVAYVTKDGQFLCVTCANGGNGSRASDEGLDETCPDDHQWIIVGAQTVTDEDDRMCAHCSRIIPIDFTQVNR